MRRRFHPQRSLALFSILPAALNVEHRKDHGEEQCRDESILYGAHETLLSEGGEADLHKHFTGCKKNPGHTQFVSVNDFNLHHLPEGYHDNDLVKLVKANADLTVRVEVTMTSNDRPEFWPNTSQLYPFYDARGRNVMRLGTGMVCDANKSKEKNIKKFNLGHCTCHRCQHSDTPSQVWGEVRIRTAKHVVFDDLEASHTTCRLFYDAQDSQLVTLKGWRVVFDAKIEKDFNVLYCLTCDIDLLDKLNKMLKHREKQWIKVQKKYNSATEEIKLIFIASHPHGLPKQISVGQWIDRYKVDDRETKIAYTASTCAGSSGAHVHALGDKTGWLFYEHHIHYGVNLKGVNISNTDRDWK